MLALRRHALQHVSHEDLSHVAMGALVRCRPCGHPVCCRADYNDSQLAEWRDVVAPRLRATRDRWARLDVAAATDERLLEGMRDMAMEEGYYWSCNSSRTFGVGKSTDDHLQVLLSRDSPTAAEEAYCRAICTQEAGRRRFQPFRLRRCHL